VLTGNSIIDALRWVAAQAPPAEVVEDLASQGVPRAFLEPEPGLRGAAGKLILVTAHRRENFGAPLEQICRALRDIAQDAGQPVHLVYPVHPNPNVVEPVRRILGAVPNITLTAPLDYHALVYLMQRSHFVMTDSGGLQEEAPSLGKPVLVLRDVTERPEGVESGVAKLVGANRTMIVEQARRLLTDEQAYASMARAVNPYGDGHASQRIVQALLDSPA
jgi:UDP-N-acetylglucosamine 2-epimerase (non-hydrolysing)